MSRQELHDLLSHLKQERNSVDIVDSEYQHRLDEIVESLEQQKLYPDTIILFNSIDEQNKKARFETLSGLENKLLKRIINIAGFT